jgi:hypothetical protein
MPHAVHILGVRHHGPGSARLVASALARLKPDAVLIEGPADASDVLPLAAHPRCIPPVALIVYEPEDPQQAAFYPFAEFSPEWQALRWAMQQGVTLEFIDLPPAARRANRRDPSTPREAVPGELAPSAHAVPPATESPTSAEPSSPEDLAPLDALALAAGYPDGEAWWGRLIEELRGDTEPLAVFAAVSEAMAATRKALVERAHDPEEAVREAHMRRAIRAAIKRGHTCIAVVCGAWHAPVLGAEALASTPARADDELLKGLRRSKTVSTWIPWTSQRLSLQSGYGAGVHSPGWYRHVWQSNAHVSESWLTTVARLLRTHGLDAPPAGVIEAVRLADGLAALRNRARPGLEELQEATLAILCHGNPLPLELIRSALIVGHRLGEVPEDTPAVPLQRDLTALQRSLRLKPTAVAQDLDLDQRKPLDLARSHLLHRLNLLDIPWGVLSTEPQSSVSTFHERWRLTWQPEFAVNLIDAARYGNTVEQAATAKAAERASQASSLPALITLLDEVLLAELTPAADQLLLRISDLSAVAADVTHLLATIPPLARIQRYGNVRSMRAATIAPMVRSMVARVCAGLVAACASLDDQAAAGMAQAIAHAHSALMTLQQEDLTSPWLLCLRALGESHSHGLISGLAWRVLLDTGAADTQAAEAQLALALSPASGPDRAAAWLEGFLGQSGLVLVHDQRLLALIDAWLCGLPRGTFEQICPVIRRTFSTFPRPERRQLGDKLRRMGHTQAPLQDADQAAMEYSSQRGQLVNPILDTILGEAPA